MNKDQNVTGSMPEKSLSRRDFIGWIIKGGLFITFLSLLLPAVEYLWPVTRRGPVGGSSDVGRADEIPVGSAKKVDVNGTPLILINTPQGFKAFSAICTHLGCLVGWDSRKQLIECPCHAGFFDLTGRVVSGPPPRPLVSFPVNVIDGKIFIKL